MFILSAYWVQRCHVLWQTMVRRKKRGYFLDILFYLEKIDTIQ